MTVEVQPAGFSRRERARFVQVPFDLYRGDPLWVAPLRFDHMRLTNPARNPFFEHAEVAHFVALRDGRVVGRVAAIENRLHNEVHEERAGHFGFFEADARDTALALLETATTWARDRGLTKVLGPVSYSTNDVCGLLVEGFDAPPRILMPYNPPAYAEWIEEAGFAKAKDLLAFWITTDNPVSPRLMKVAERLAVRSGLTLRPLRMSRFREEVALVSDLYNRAWEKNWGFVPMTDAELDHMASELRPIVDPRCVLFAEQRGEVVGFSLAIPDLHRILIGNRSGRLFPFGLLRILLGKSKLRELRLLTLGVLPEHRSKGIDAALIHGAVTMYQEAGYHGCECSWILEDNEKMLAGMELLGGTIDKRYRIYERSTESRHTESDSR